MDKQLIWVGIELNSELTGEMDISDREDVLDVLRNSRVSDIVDILDDRDISIKLLEDV